MAPPFLIFCSFEVGGLPFQIAETLNRLGKPTLYVSVAQNETCAFNTTRYHFPGASPPWDISTQFAGAGATGIVTRLRQLKRQRGLRACFATGGKAHLLTRAGIPYHYWVSGSDLDQSCFSPIWPEAYPLWKRAILLPLFLARTRRDARRSIRQAQAATIAPYQKPALDKIAPGMQLFFLPHLLPVRTWNQTLADNEAARQKVAIRIGPGRYIFSAARHVWSGTMKDHADRKGNDLMVRGFQEYVTRSGDLQTRLVLVRKGPDVEATAALARELKMAERIVWVEEMSRSEVHEFHAAAEACLGQFGPPVLTYAALEPLAHGTPTASFFGQAEGVPAYPSQPPVFYADSPATICEFLVQILADSCERSRLGHACWQWVASQCSEARLVDVFDTMMPISPPVSEGYEP